MSANKLKKLSARTDQFHESVIREMTRLGEEVKGVDLAQGLPDFPPPPQLIEALQKVIQDSVNHQYTFTWGSFEFREAVAKKYSIYNKMDLDPNTEITITCGVSEALIASIMALTEPGDEVIIFEPFYENYVPACFLAGATPRFVQVQEPDYILDIAKLRKAINRKTRLILLNTPGNPSGHVLSQQELRAVADICKEFGLIAVVDEIYEHIWYEQRHVSLASLHGAWDYTVTLSGLGKSYGVTGWRVGWVVAPRPLMAKIRKVHDYLTVCAPAPFQEAGRVALALSNEYYVHLREAYAKRRDILLPALKKAGFTFTAPQGAYYVMADAASLGWKDDRKFVEYLARKVGLIAVPGSSFYSDGKGKTKIRLNFAKKDETLNRAVKLLQSAKLKV